MLRPLDADAPYDIGPYRLLAGLGSGGMGTVHLAVPPGGGPEGLVALKTVRRDLEHAGDFRLRFRREAEAARAVRGPYVSALVDGDPEAERPWLATQYIAGPSLEEAVGRHGPLPVPVVRDLGAAIARGLAAVHGARLVHRDLKPANVVLGATGPRLIDFGIAQAYDMTALTATGVMVGSPGFMSPEHVAGDRSVTGASDVFCLGAVLCFAATGHGPFEDTELAAIVHRIAQGRPELSRVPDELRQTVADCLHRDPARRPTTAELIRALDTSSRPQRPGVPPASAPGAFPWPDGIRELIGTYETAVVAALEAPPMPRTAPAAAPAGAARASRHGQSEGDGNGAADGQPGQRAGRSRTGRPAWARGRRLGLAVGVGAGLLAGVLTAALLLLPDDDPEPGTPGNAAPAPDRSAGSTAPSATPPARTAPVAVSGMADFGPDSLDRTLQPDNWRPWATSFDGPGAADDCALSGDVLVCRLRDEATRQTRLEARDASDGSRLWRYPAEGAPTGLLGVGGLDVDDRHAYVTAADGDGFDVLNLSDGKPVARLPGRTGYTPSVARVHEGRIFVSYTGVGGAGGAANMLFRAYDADDRAQVWERVIAWAFPPSLDVVGDRVWLTGSQETLTLDPATGKTLAEAPWNCDRRIRSAPYDVCGGGIVDARTLRKVGDTRAPSPEAVSRDGLLFVEGKGLREGSRYIQAIDARSGDERWTAPWKRGDSVVVAGDRLLTFGVNGVRAFALDDGAPEATLGNIRDWPRKGSAFDGVKAQPTTVLVSGGACFLTFDDGTVMTAPAS
ncbi:protein kinase [Streptomyces sp. SH5]|uniref:protein kinase domain-containing protein n=1 Tax=Streptomyces sp. SH5 TaxID=3041765 RepID=UPI002477F675|nr:protein kinase [Streptomyces sp. SH5]WGP12444.1 protein kinase [Streptomyces sp. SH5]